ncbi:MAG: hypothetical protein ABIM31_06860 [candidate division WOR-3 bacterium]
MKTREIRGAKEFLGWIERDPDGTERLYSHYKGYFGMYNLNPDTTIVADGRTWLSNRLLYLLREAIQNRELLR